MRRLSQREVKQLAQGHTSQQVASLIPKPKFLTSTLCSRHSSSPRFPLLLSLSSWSCPHTESSATRGLLLYILCSPGCSSPPCPHTPCWALQGLSAPVICCLVSPVTAQGALWSWSFTDCLRFSLSLKGTGVPFPHHRHFCSVHSTCLAHPRVPSGVTGCRVGAAVTQRVTERPDVLLRVVTLRKCSSRGVAPSLGDVSLRWYFWFSQGLQGVGVQMGKSHI